MDLAPLHGLLVEILGGLARLILEPEQKVAVHARAVGRQRAGLAEAVDRLVEAAQRLVDQRDIVPGFRRAWLQGHRTLEALAGLAEFALVEIGGAEMAPGLGIFGRLVD